jgi:hypothetical protein
MDDISEIKLDKDQKTKNPILQWTDQTETLLVKWADNASCYKWLHDRSFRRFRLKNYLFNIPVIILSTLTGTLNFGINSIISEKYITYAQIAIGCINIFTGIITTLLNFFRYAQNSEAHYNAEIGWSKLNRNIVNELALDRESRKEANTFIKLCRSDYDRLIEQAPIIPLYIIDEFKRTHDNLDLIFPDICDVLMHTEVYRESRLKRENTTMNSPDLLDMDQ